MRCDAAVDAGLVMPPNFHIVPFASFKHNAARFGYILGFLAYAESLCTLTPHLALSVLTIFVDFVVRGWPPRLVGFEILNFSLECMHVPLLEAAHTPNCSGSHREARGADRSRGER